MPDTITPVRGQEVVATVADPGNGIDGSDSTFAAVEQNTEGLSAFYVLDQFPADTYGGTRSAASMKVRGEWVSGDSLDEIRVWARAVQADPWTQVVSINPNAKWPLGGLSEAGFDIYPVVGTTASTGWQVGLQFNNKPGGGDAPDIGDGQD